MSDSRDTERLLEVIGEQASEIKLWTNDTSPDLEEIAKAAQVIAEAAAQCLRRGDTLVRARDLAHVNQFYDTHRNEYGYAEVDAAHQRLEIALGGKLR